MEQRRIRRFRWKASEDGNRTRRRGNENELEVEVGVKGTWRGVKNVKVVR